MMRSRMYGTHINPVRMTVSVSHSSSLDIAVPQSCYKPGAA
jgi:hypothetical protein